MCNIKPIPGYEDRYSATIDGQILSNYNHRFMTLKMSNCGYKKITLTIKAKGRGFTVHRLIAAAFLGLDLNDSNIQVDHIDGDRTNNAVNNLRLCTCRENHAAKVGRLGVNNETHRLCSKCRKILIKEKFNVNRKNLDGLQSWCRDCNIESKKGLL